MMSGSKTSSCWRNSHLAATILATNDSPAFSSSLCASSASAALSSKMSIRIFSLITLLVLLGRGLVHHQPVKLQFLDYPREIFEHDGLDHVAVGPQLVAPVDVRLLSRGSHDDHGDSLGPFIGLHPAQHLVTRDLRQLQVEKDHPGAYAFCSVFPGIQHIQRFPAVPRDPDSVAQVVLPEATE